MGCQGALTSLKSLWSTPPTSPLLVSLLGPLSQVCHLSTPASSDTRPLRPGHSAGALGAGLSTVHGWVTVWVVWLVPARAIGLVESELATLARFLGGLSGPRLWSPRGGVETQDFPSLSQVGGTFCWWRQKSQTPAGQAHSSESQRPGHGPPPPEHWGVWPLQPLLGWSGPCPHGWWHPWSPLGPLQAGPRGVFLQGGHQRARQAQRGDHGPPPIELSRSSAVSWDTTLGGCSGAVGPRGMLSSEGRGRTCSSRLTQGCWALVLGRPQGFQHCLVSGKSLRDPG